jgi:hypothetical protein
MSKSKKHAIISDINKDVDEPLKMIDTMTTLWLSIAKSHGYSIKEIKKEIIKEVTVTIDKECSKGVPYEHL